MKSPFPGMDPYLEPHWRDVHQSLIIYVRDQIQHKLPGNLIARVEERVYVQPDEEGDGGRGIYPDVRVTENLARAASAGQAGDVAVAEPLVLYIGDEPATEGFVEIREAAPGHRLITAIEVLSWSNKSSSDGRALYRQKQEELRAARVSLVEIDLLRGGKRVFALGPMRIPPAYQTTYQVCVRRGWRLGEAEIYRAPLRSPLPKIKIPLRKTDDDVALDLQSLIEQCYVNGRYDSIDYTVDLEPPLEPADAAWANELLKAAARR